MDQTKVRTRLIDYIFCLGAEGTWSVIKELPAEGRP